MPLGRSTTVHLGVVGFQPDFHGKNSWEIFMGDFHGKVMGQLGLGRISGGIE
jgi:hypothetical protein